MTAPLASGRPGRQAAVVGETVTTRRTPQQARSEARVQSILDAAAAELHERGYDGLTTQRVADRAEMSIGAIYRYFPDKRALAKALAQRNLDRFATRVLARTALIEELDWWRTVDAAIDEFVAMHREEPGFRAIRFGDVVDQALLQQDRSNNDVIGGMLIDFGAELLGVEPTPEIEFAVDIAVELTDALLKRAFAQDPAGDERIIAECRRVIYEYLVPLLGESPGAPG